MQPPTPTPTQNKIDLGTQLITSVATLNSKQFEVEAALGNSNNSSARGAVVPNWLTL